MANCDGCGRPLAEQVPAFPTSLWVTSDGHIPDQYRKALHVTIRYQHVMWSGFFDSWTCFEEWQKNKVLPAIAVEVLAGA